MEETYQYPVFFECGNLDGEQRKRIENYFHIRRKSGGGECGLVTNINNKVCSIAFKERDGKTLIDWFFLKSLTDFFVVDFLNVGFLGAGEGESESTCCTESKLIICVLFDQIDQLHCVHTHI